MGVIIGKNVSSNHQEKFKNSSDIELICLIETVTKLIGELPTMTSKIRSLLIASSVGLLLSTNAYSQTQSFRCSFSDGLVTNWDAGKPSSKRSGDFPELVFDQLDIKKGTGRMIGNAGAENVQVLNGDNSIHIVERTMSGNLNLTTIVLSNNKNPNFFPVTHSRHLNLSGGPLMSQFIGFCKKLN